MSSNPVAKSKTITVDLEHPFEFEGVEQTSVILRRVKGKDIRAIDGMEGTESSFKLMSLLSGMPPAFFDEMDGADLETVGDKVEGFMGRSKARRRKT